MYPALSSSRLSSPRIRLITFILRDFQRPAIVKVTAQDKLKTGGSAPTFWQSIRPKVLSGSLPPQVTGNRTACFGRERVLSDGLYAAPHAACPTRLHTERRRLLATLQGTT